MAVQSRTQVIPLANYPAGSRTFGPITIDDSITSFSFEVQRCTSATPTIWPNQSVKLAVNVEFSFDGGATWVGGGGMEAEGGIHTLISGEQATISHFEIPYIPPGSGRRMRANVTITGGPLRTSGTLELRN